MSLRSPLVLLLLALGCDDKAVLDSAIPDADSDGWTADQDCDDEAPEVYPGGPELCDAVDNDCDEFVDENPQDILTWYVDSDGDGYGDPELSEESCDQPSGYVSDNTDCDDASERTAPGLEEDCDNRDNDCDRIVDEETRDGGWYAVDEDGDGYGAAGSLAWTCVGVPNDLDCDDREPGEPEVADVNGVAGWPTIQQAIDAADSCVVVEPGLYSEAIDFRGKSIAVRSVSGQSETSIDATGRGAPVVTIASGEGPGAVLSGFTLLGGEGFVAERSEVGADCNSTGYCVDYYFNHCGGGIYIDGASPTLEDLRIAESSLPDASVAVINDWTTYYYFSFGGGICMKNATATLAGVTIEGNRADQGGALYIDAASSLEISQTSVLDNAATEGGGLMVDGGQVWLTNALIAWNTASSDGGGLLVLDGAAELTNVTVGGGASQLGGGLSVAGVGQLILHNSIVYGATSGSGLRADGSAIVAVSYSDVFGNDGGEYDGLSDPTGASGNLSEDPLFEDVTDDGEPDNDDWGLGAGSPAIDAGDPGSGYSDGDDSRNDMGAYGGPGGEW